MTVSVSITDDFDLHKIATCGQCFRSKCMLDGKYRFVTGGEVLYIYAGERPREYLISCDLNTWNRVWVRYFNLDLDYEKIRGSLSSGDDFVSRVSEFGSGIRILQQDAWEMIITFIISQRKSIPAIAGCVEQLCSRAGSVLQTEFERLSLFPTPEQILNMSAEELAECKTGYRSRYIVAAAQDVASGKIDLLALARMSDKELMFELLQLYGVGEKVASCIALFGFGRHAIAPVDVWISRAINDEFGGKNPFDSFGSYAGIIQQYIFFYEINAKMK